METVLLEKKERLLRQEGCGSPQRDGTVDPERPTLSGRSLPVDSVFLRSLLTLATHRATMEEAGPGPSAATCGPTEVSDTPKVKKAVT